VNEDPRMAGGGAMASAGGVNAVSSVHGMNMDMDSMPAVNHVPPNRMMPQGMGGPQGGMGGPHHVGGARNALGGGAGVGVGPAAGMPGNLMGRQQGAGAPQVNPFTGAHQPGMMDMQQQMHLMAQMHMAQMHMAQAQAQRGGSQAPMGQGVEQSFPPMHPQIAMQMQRQQMMMRPQQMAGGGEVPAAAGTQPNVAKPGVPVEPPKPREKKLLFTISKETGEAKPEASASKPASSQSSAADASSAPVPSKPAPAPTPASSPAPAAAMVRPQAKQTESEGRGDKSSGGAGERNTSGGASKREASAGAHPGGNTQRNQPGAHGSAEGAGAAAATPSTENGGENDKPSKYSVRGGGKADAGPPPSPRTGGPQPVRQGQGGRGDRPETAKQEAPPAAGSQSKLPADKLQAAGPMKGAGAGEKSAGGDAPAPAAASAPSPKAAPASQPAAEAAKARAAVYLSPLEDVSKLNGEPEKGAKQSEAATAVAKEPEPVAGAPAKKEEKSHDESAKQAPARTSTPPAPTIEKIVNTVEPSPKTPPAPAEKEVPKAADSQASKDAEAPAAPAEPPAARPVEAEAVKEPVTSEAPKKPVKSEEPKATATPKPPREKKPRPVLKEGERLIYDINFIFKFQGLCNEAAYVENVRLQVQNTPVLGGGGGARPGSGSFAPAAGAMGAGGRAGAPMAQAGRAVVGRGGGGGGGGMRDRGPPQRGARGQDMGYPMGNTKSLKPSENAFLIKNKAQTHYDALMKEARSILNKLTMTTFDKLASDLANVEIRAAEELRGIVSIIFDKALEEGHFCKMYAELCNYLKDHLKEFEDDADPALGETKVKKVTFKRCLLNKCQEEFERADRYDEANDQETLHLEQAAKAAKTRRVRIRMLGNIKFIGELFAQRILNEKIMHDCVKKLLESKEEDTIECLCKLMATVGKLLDREEAKHYMDYYFDQMKQTANEIGSNPTLFPSGKRLKFMIIDTIDLRKQRYPAILPSLPLPDTRLISIPAFPHYH